MIRKIVRGLHYANHGTPMPANAKIEVAPDLKEDHLHELLAMLTGPWHGWQNRVFNYKFSHVAGRFDLALWLLVFYDRFAAMAVVNGHEAT